ncbi:MAG: protein kinase [Sandaracinaceae bacterium]|nr:protein kinase [Sandaracinaceae bacterium]
MGSADSLPAGGAPPAGLGPGERSVVAGRYRLLEEIAEGGMGIVFKAEHTLSKKKLALKVVHPYLCKGRQGVERFRREVSAAAEIDHPGIVQIYDAGVDDDGGFFMAMELLQGESLGDRLRRHWPGMATSVRYIEGMLEPLAKAHAKNIVHRDLKPDNVFLTVDEEGRERVKLLDFGLAREIDKAGPTRTGITFGTPEYMSPEQAMSARKVKTPGDVWSVAVMLYELLSGRHPFQGETPNAVMANAIKEPLPSLAETAPHVPAPLARMIERCLDKEPDNRPQTAGEMLDELRRVLEQVSLDETAPVAPVAPPSGHVGSEDEGPVVSAEILVAPPPSLGGVSHRDTMASRSRPRWGLYAGLGAVALVGLSLLGLWGYQRLGAGPTQITARPLEPTGATLAPPSPPPVAGATEPAAQVEPALPEPGAAEPGAAEPRAAEPVEPAPPPTAPSGVEGPSPTRAARPEAPRVGPSPLEAARACLQQADKQCARQALEGRARTAAEHALLIQTYQDLRMDPQALAAMRRFVRQFPTAPQTPRYREYLAGHGG